MPTLKHHLHDRYIHKSTAINSRRPIVHRMELLVRLFQDNLTIIIQQLLYNRHRPMAVATVVATVVVTIEVVAVEVHWQVLV